MKLYLFGTVILLSMLAIAAFAFRRSPSQQRVVILLGPPGSGKGTQAVRISKELGIPHIATGDMFRENISKNTELGKRAKSYIDAGKLSPDELVLDMLFERISRPDAANGYLLDGFPRTIPQAEALDKVISKDASLTAINLRVSDESVIKRIAGRLTCKGCGKIYNKYMSNPQKENVCDTCSGELYQRSDDAEEVVKERLKVYNAQTAPLIQYYDKKKVLYTIDGEQNPDTVFKEAMEILKS